MPVRSCELRGAVVGHFFVLRAEEKKKNWRRWMRIRRKGQFTRVIVIIAAATEKWW